ncbi:MAG: MG2 domain-containing protein, partial [Planctomycetes bacterium]|nr:MG2 domain-containing protein [Planctomycetota bacterium]
IDTEYAKAESAYQKKNYQAARELWSEFLAKYPLDERGRSILFRFGQMQFAEEKWESAIDEWRRLVSKYPQTAEASQAQYMIALTLEEKLDRLEEALKEYRKTTWGRYQKTAQQRIARLTAKSLRVVTERVFRSDETPTLKLVSRNIECVTVQVYSVDMETYFRKMHAARGVEGLDIALIDPDRTFEYQIPDYREYARSECLVEVPLPTAADAAAGQDKPTAGVMAVTVSSKTLEATTLVVQSDLDVILKSSRDEVFVFAENMRTGQPWPNARILLSNGKQVFAEGQTGDDGVFHQAFEELRSAEDLRVFAVADRHTASNMVGLNGLGFAQGLDRKGYLYSDRPAYRPGQIVHLRGVIRKVDGDTYAVAEGKSYRVDVYDSRNRLIHDTEVTLNEFGSFHTHLVLPTAAAQGEYRVLVHDQDRESYQGTFSVQDYKLEPVQLQIETPRAVYYRGEMVEGVIRATYYYGAPLVDREIRYGWGGQRVYTAKTDNQGEVHFRLETRVFRESQPLALSVAFPERNLSLVKTFYLSTQGFQLESETVRDVYLAGESFELKVKASDAEGEPVQQDLTLSVLRHTEIDGQQGEVLVETHPLKTDANGAGRQTLKLDEGGRYTLRIAGTDRFQNTIEAETFVHISDDQDQTRLRILADQHTYRVGDAAEVRIHWREEPALALVTFEGAKILDYQLLRLNKGENRLKIPMTASLAPNFDLAVAVMTDARPKPEDKIQVRRFHESSSPFEVQRELNVSLDWKRQHGDGEKDDVPLRPGDAIDVTLT